MLKRFATSHLAAFVVFWAIPLQAIAAPLLSVEIKFDPDQFKQGAILDLPVVLVENRAAGEQSLFQGPYPPPPQPATLPGPFPLASVGTEMETIQSRFISFTPVVAFDAAQTVLLQDHDLQFFVRSNAGLPVTLDNTGITGRSEIQIGTLRVEVGASIPQDDGIGDPEPDLVFQLKIGLDPSTSHNASRFLDVGVTQSLNGLSPKEYKISATPPATPTPVPPTGVAGTFVPVGKTYKNESGKFFPNFDCAGNPGDTCNGKAQFYVSQKINGKTKTTVYAKCTLYETLAGAPTYCEMKLNKVAKDLLKANKKLKGKLLVNSTGISAKSETKATVK